MDFWSYFWLLVWWFFFIAFLMVLFQIFGDLFRDDELGGFAKALWVIFLIFIPLMEPLIDPRRRRVDVLEMAEHRAVGKRLPHLLVGAIAVMFGPRMGHPFLDRTYESRAAAPRAIVPESDATFRPHPVASRR